MTDEEKKEYRDKLVEDCMKYNHIDYDDDKDIVETMVEAIASEELMYQKNSHASKEYRIEMAKAMVRRLVKEVAQ